MTSAVEDLAHAMLTNSHNANPVSVNAKNIALRAFVVTTAEFKGLECTLMTLIDDSVRVKVEEQSYNAESLECRIPEPILAANQVMCTMLRILMM